MAYDNGLAERIRDYFSYEDIPNITERKMFGGLAFMFNGHMSVGVGDEWLMVRTGPDNHQKALDMPHARPMTFTGKPMKGFVFVDFDGIENDSDLNDWIILALSFVKTLPPK